MRKYDNFDKKQDRAVMFFSASSTRNAQMIYDCNISEILISYHYINKSLNYYENELMPKVKSRGGLFMTDSGVFSFVNMDAADRSEAFYTKQYWQGYIEDYVAFIERNYKNIYVCANFDLDTIVGEGVVREWNKKYFEPLEKLTQVCYVSHITEKDPTGLKNLEYYCQRYRYVGVNQSSKKYASQIYTIASRYKTRIHGFAWTSIPLLKQYPFFSVDSTTWLGGLRYGTTYVYDGKNAKVKDYKNKHVRKKQHLLCRDIGVDMNALLADDNDSLNKFNLENWKGFRNEYLKAANRKLKTEPPYYYQK